MFLSGSIDTAQASANGSLFWTESTIMADIRPLKLEVPNDQESETTALDSIVAVSISAAVPSLSRPLQLLHAAIFLSGAYIAIM